MQACSRRSIRFVAAGPPARRSSLALLTVLFLLHAMFAVVLNGQAQTPASRQIGTVKEISPNRLLILSDAGQRYSVNVVVDAKVFQLPPGSTDLKNAQAIALTDVEVGDRVLVSGHQDAADAFTASRVILMKSSAIAEKNQTAQEDWQKRGAGGLVSSVDQSTGMISVTVRARTIAVQTTPATIYKRYSGDSVRYEDAKPGYLNQIKAGDQLRVRGAKSDSAGTGSLQIQAEEIVSGTFRNLAGTIVSLDSAAGSLTLRDGTSKKTYALRVTANSSIRTLPPEAAARFAATSRSPQASASGEQRSSSAHDTSASARPDLTKQGSGQNSSQSQRSANDDLSQLLSRLPQKSLGDLHVGDALLVVASQPQGENVSLTAITVLSGVEAILAANPGGSPSVTLSPWNLDGATDAGARD